MTENTDLQLQVTSLTNDLEAARQRIRRLITDHAAHQQAVRSAFQELVDEGEIEVGKANEVLSDLGIELLAVEWEWEAEVTIRGYAKAPSADTLENALEHAGGVELDVYDSEVSDIEVQDVSIGTVTVDRVVH